MGWIFQDVNFTQVKERTVQDTIGSLLEVTQQTIQDIMQISTRSYRSNLFSKIQFFDFTWSQMITNFEVKTTNFFKIQYLYSKPVTRIQNLEANDRPYSSWWQTFQDIYKPLFDVDDKLFKMLCGSLLEVDNKLFKIWHLY